MDEEAINTNLETFENNWETITIKVNARKKRIDANN